MRGTFWLVWDIGETKFWISVGIGIGIGGIGDRGRGSEEVSKQGAGLGRRKLWGESCWGASAPRTGLIRPTKSQALEDLDWISVLRWGVTE